MFPVCTVMAGEADQNYTKKKKNNKILVKTICVSNENSKPITRIVNDTDGFRRRLNRDRTWHRRWGMS